MRRAGCVTTGIGVQQNARQYDTPAQYSDCAIVIDVTAPPALPAKHLCEPPTPVILSAAKNPTVSSPPSHLPPLTIDPKKRDQIPTLIPLATAILGRSTRLLPARVSSRSHHR
jgi:hypothetical protein